MANIDLWSLPLGTRFYVNNGNWHGRICGSHEAKAIFVEETGRTFLIPEDEDYRNSLDISVAEDYVEGYEW